MQNGNEKIFSSGNEFDFSVFGENLNIVDVTEITDANNSNIESVILSMYNYFSKQQKTGNRK